jgi:hypothetical protein
MKKTGTNSPLLGYNTNVKHDKHVFHIQTEDSGRDHPHIITHLFTSGTILATKKTAYEEYLGNDNWEDQIKQLMKDQHKAMFVELRDGTHDSFAARILGKQIGDCFPDGGDAPKISSDAPPAPSGDVQMIAPADMMDDSSETTPVKEQRSYGKSIFDTPDRDSTFGESLISDKSLDEVILTYLKDELGD